MRVVKAAAISLVGVGALVGGAAIHHWNRPAWVPMRVDSVEQLRVGSVVQLRSDDRDALPIYIGDMEADAISRRMQGVKMPRPMTHDLLESTVTALGAKIERVEVEELRADTYIGKLYVKDSAGKTLKIDARPSDLIALAVGQHLPIYASGQVLDQAKEAH
jgi:bifunctional DNase/RNase